MSLKRKLIGFAFSLLLVILVVFCTLTFLYFNIPPYVESKLLPEIAHKAGIRDYACDVRRIGFFGADLGSVRIGNDKNPALSIASVQIDYSPGELYKKKIKSVVLSGIELFCEYKNGKFRIREFDLKPILAQIQSSRKTASSSTDASRTISIGRLEIRNAVVVFEFKEKSLRLPIELEIVPGKTDQGTSDGDVLESILRLYPRGQEIVFSANIYMGKKQILLGFDATSVHLERFADFAKQIPGLTLSGEADINGKASIQFMPFKISSASARCQFRNAEIAYKNLILKTSQNTQKEKRPFKIEINQMGGKEWKISGTAISAVSPLPMQVADINCDLKISKDAVFASGNFTIALEQLNGNQTTLVKMLEPLDIKGNYFAKLAKNGEWEFGVKNTAQNKSAGTPRNCKLKINGFDIVTNQPVFDVSGKGKHATGSATYKVVAPHVNVNAIFGTIKIPSISLKGKARLGNSAKKGRGFATFELKAPDTDLTTASAKIKIPMVSLTGELWEGKNRALHVDSIFKFEDTSITDSKLKTKINGICGIIPLKWPFKGTCEKGKYSVKRLWWKNRNMGSLKGTVQQKGSGLVFKGVHISSLLQDLSLNFTGETGMLSSIDYEAGIHFELNRYKTVSDIDLEQFILSAKDVTFNGEFGLNGDLTFDNTGIKSSLNVNIYNANLMLKEKKAAIEGIQTALFITDLFKIRSAPKQEFNFDKASLGGLNIHDGKIEFQIESTGSLLIEKSSFGWCDGNVYTQAMRISPKIKDYNLILYCDRLKLAMILEQFGAVNAQGDGTVNGRLPIRIKNGKISFKDGFLFSTPGDGGTIRLAGTEILTEGIPTNTPQYAQIELAREALKDYNYDWAKLNLMTEGENVLLRLQFDGKPARPLPFVYKKEIGGFAKVEAGGKGSIFQGISLDVNFKVPLNKILHYKDLLDMIQ
jgi:hypothetical protein